MTFINFNLKIDPILIHFLDHYEENPIKNVMLNGIFKLYLNSDNIYIKIEFLKHMLKTYNLKYDLLKSIYFKPYSNINILNSIIGDPFYNLITNDTFVDIIVNLYDNNYYDICSHFIPIVKKYIRKFSKTQYEDISDKDKLNYECDMIRMNCTFFCIKLFNKIDKYRHTFFGSKPSQLFNSIVRLLDIGCINYIEEISLRTNDLEDMKMNIMEFEFKNDNILTSTDNSQITLLNKSILKGLHINLNKITERIKILTKLKYDIYNPLIYNFIHELLKYLNIYLQSSSVDTCIIPNLDTILDSIIVYYTHYTSLLNTRVLDRDCMTLLKIIISKPITHNLNIKAKALGLLNLKTTDLYPNVYLESFKSDSLFWCSHIIDTVIELYKYILDDDYHLSYTIYELNLPFICNMITYCIGINDSLIDSINVDHFKTFIHICIEGWHYEWNDIYNTFEEIKLIINNLFNNSMIDDIILRVISDSISYNSYLTHIKHFKYYMSFFMNLSSMKYQHLLFSYENMYYYVDILNKMLINIYDIDIDFFYTMELKLFQSNMTSIIANNYKSIIVYIYDLLSYTLNYKFNDLVSIYSIEYTDYNITAWYTWMDFCSKKLNISNKYILDVAILTHLIKTNNRIYSKCKSSYLDPITTTLINEPIILPPNIVMDKYIIYKHLVIHNYNPFNREKLSIELLENFNELKSTKDKLIQFKQDFKRELIKFK